MQFMNATIVSTIAKQILIQTLGVDKVLCDPQRAPFKLKLCKHSTYASKK